MLTSLILLVQNSTSEPGVLFSRVRGCRGWREWGWSRQGGCSGAKSTLLFESNQVFLLDQSALLNVSKLRKLPRVSGIKSINMLGTRELQNAVRWHYTEGFAVTCADGKRSYRYPSGPEGSRFLLMKVMVSLVTWLWKKPRLRSWYCTCKNVSKFWIMTIHPETFLTWQLFTPLALCYLVCEDFIEGLCLGRNDWQVRALLCLVGQHKQHQQTGHKIIQIFIIWAI